MMSRLSQITARSLLSWPRPRSAPCWGPGRRGWWAASGARCTRASSRPSAGSRGAPRCPSWPTPRTGCPPWSPGPTPTRAASRTSAPSPARSPRSSTPWWWCPRPRSPGGCCRAKTCSRGRTSCELRSYSLDAAARIAWVRLLSGTRHSSCPVTRKKSNWFDLTWRHTTPCCWWQRGRDPGDPLISTGWRC